MNKVIIITGASSGFGKSIAERLSQHGHTVYGICRRQMEHHAIKYMQGDIRDTNRIAQIIKDIYDKEKRIDVLINNAGMGLGGALELDSYVTSWSILKSHERSGKHDDGQAGQRAYGSEYTHSPILRRDRASALF